MNKLLLNEGGQPFTLEDLDFLQTSIERGLNALSSRLPDGLYFDYKLQKPEANGGEEKLVWSDGFILLSGRIAFIEAGEITNPEHFSKYAVRRRELSTAVRTFADSSTHATQLIERAEIVLRSTLSSDEPTLPLGELYSHSPKLVSIRSTLSARVEWRGEVLGQLVCLRTDLGFNIVTGEFVLPRELATSKESADLRYFAKGSPFNGGGYLSSPSLLPWGLSLQAVGTKLRILGLGDESDYPERAPLVTITYLSYSYNS